jgi:hypothetical protein
MIYKALKTVVSSLVVPTPFANAMTTLSAMFAATATTPDDTPPTGGGDKSNLDRLIDVGIPHDVAKNALELANDNLPMASGIVAEQLRQNFFLPTRQGRMADEDKAMGNVLRQSKKENAKYKRYKSKMDKTLTMSHPVSTKRTPVAKRAPTRSTPKKVATRRGKATRRQIVRPPQDDRSSIFRLGQYSSRLHGFPKAARVLKDALLKIEDKPTAERTSSDFYPSQAKFRGAPREVTYVLNVLEAHPWLVSEAISALQSPAGSK